MNILKKTIFIITFIVIGSSPGVSFALSFNIESSDSNYQPNTQFAVDVMLDPEGNVINGIEGEISVTNNVAIVRIENGGSIVKNWITQPQVVSGKNSQGIQFSGIIPNGFGGYVNTGPSGKSGLVLRVILEAKNTGQIGFGLKNIIATKNDGQGTLIKGENKNIFIQISNTGSSQKYTTNDFERPTINYEIVQDPNLFDGKKTLVFNAIDSKSGIASVYVQEGKRESKEIQGPYVLEDQSLKGIISLRVLDNAGNETLIEIKPSLASYVSSNMVKILGGVIVLVILVNLYYAKRNKKNKKSR